MPKLSSFIRPRWKMSRRLPRGIRREARGRRAVFLMSWIGESIWFVSRRTDFHYSTAAYVKLPSAAFLSIWFFAPIMSTSSLSPWRTASGDHASGKNEPNPFDTRLSPEAVRLPQPTDLRARGLLCTRLQANQRLDRLLRYPWRRNGSGTAGAPRSKPSVLKSSSRSGQFIPYPAPAIFQRERCSVLAFNSLGYQTKGTMIVRPPARSTANVSSVT